MVLHSLAPVWDQSTPKWKLRDCPKLSAEVGGIKDVEEGVEPHQAKATKSATLSPADPKCSKYLDYKNHNGHEVKDTIDGTTLFNEPSAGNYSEVRMYEELEPDDRLDSHASPTAAPKMHLSNKWPIERHPKGRSKVKIQVP
ncbi:MAG: hypothetical protein M1822_006267 [Bathelium mastoideum]|nr:MAG: hypothetical protein M1822_006267 [Bathelium mastoideum]